MVTRVGTEIIKVAGYKGCASGLPKSINIDNTKLVTSLDETPGKSYIQKRIQRCNNNNVKKTYKQPTVTQHHLGQAGQGVDLLEVNNI